MAPECISSRDRSSCFILRFSTNKDFLRRCFPPLNCFSDTFSSSFIDQLPKHIQTQLLPSSIIFPNGTQKAENCLCWSRPHGQETCSTFSQPNSSSRAGSSKHTR